jgi:hypothetical protein
MSKILDSNDRKKLITDRDGGLSPTELKKKYGFTDDRTLKKHIQLGELEQEARSIKNDILREALREHLNEIRDLIAQLQGTVTLPLIFEVSSVTTPRRDSFESGDLFAGVKEHLPNATFWRNYASWNAKLENFTTRYEQLKKDIEDEAANWGAQRVVTKTFALPVLKRLHGKLSGETNFRHMFSKSQTRESAHQKVIREFEILSVDGYDVVEADNALAFRDRYQSLSDRIAGSEEAVELVNLFLNLKEAGQAIEEDIRLFLLRRDYILYNCRFCPGQHGLLLSKKTKLATAKKLSKIEKGKIK